MSTFLVVQGMRDIENNFNKHLAFRNLYGSSSRTMTPHLLQALLALAKDSK